MGRCFLQLQERFRKAFTLQYFSGTPSVACIGFPTLQFDGWSPPATPPPYPASSCEAWYWWRVKERQVLRPNPDTPPSPQPSCRSLEFSGNKYSPQELNTNIFVMEQIDMERRIYLMEQIDMERRIHVMEQIDTERRIYVMEQLDMDSRIHVMEQIDMERNVYFME